ncbi:MAG: PDC sensor domain-containing protein [Desulfobacterales bacterium]|nr:PDC sensor domain-containing protein [Desulfobacterales bacterium]
MTQITVLTLSMPVHRRDGSFAGVTAIDVLVPGIFEELIPVKLEFLKSDDLDQLEALIKDAMDSRSGIRKMEYNGRE